MDYPFGPPAMAAPLEQSHLQMIWATDSEMSFSDSLRNAKNVFRGKMDEEIR